MPGRCVSRRALLRGVGGLALLGPLAACATSYPDLSLTVATGFDGGPYNTLGRALATAWGTALGTSRPPDVVRTAGSIENLQVLSGTATEVVAFNQIDTASDYLAHRAPTDPGAVRALARIYDDFVHVVVPATSPITSLRGLRGKRVAVGSRGSGVLVVAGRMLQALDISPDDVVADFSTIDAATAKLRGNEIDAFFWSGGLPTRQVAELASSTPIRLLDLQDDFAAIHDRHPEYAPGTVPAGTYGLARPVTTLLLRNVLLVRASMPDDIAHTLVAGLFDDQEQIAQSSPNALTINTRAAIGTQPVPLHPGAERWFREDRDS